VYVQLEAKLHQDSGKQVTVCMYSLRQSCTRIHESRFLCLSIACGRVATRYPGTDSLCIMYGLNLNLSCISIPKVRFRYKGTACSRAAPVYLSTGTWVSMYTLQLIYNRIPKVRFPCFCTACSGAALGSRVCSGAA